MRPLRRASFAPFLSKQPWICSDCCKRLTRSDSRFLSFSKSSRSRVATQLVVEHAEDEPAQANRELTSRLQDTPDEHPSNPIVRGKRQHQPSSPLKNFLLARLQEGNKTESSLNGDKYGFLECLQKGTPTEVYAAVVEAKGDQQLLRSISLQTWTEILRRIDSRTIDLYKDLPSVIITSKGFGRPNLQLEQISQQTLDMLSDVVGIRRAAGIALDLPSYRILLQHGARTANAGASKAVWNDMLHDQIMPDLECFNARMQAIIAQASITIWEVRPKYYEETLQDTMKWSLSFEVEELIEVMSKQYKIQPDTTSYVALFAAYCIEGKLKAADELLAHVWGFGHTAISTDEKFESKFYFPPNHPLCPTKELMSTVADLFGFRNRLLLASRLIHHISDKYSIAPGRRVVFALTHWTYFHARMSGRKAKVQGQIKGPNPGIPLAYLKLPRLYRMLSSQGLTRDDPLLMHLLLLNSRGLHPRGLEAFKDHLKVGMELVSKQARRSQKSTRQLLNVTGLPPGLASIETRRERAHMDLLNKRSRDLRQAYIYRWLRVAISGGIPDSARLSPQEKAAELDRQLRGIPHLVGLFRNYLPSWVRYPTPTGYVVIHAGVGTGPRGRRQLQLDAFARRRLRWMVFDRKWRKDFRKRQSRNEELSMLPEDDTEAVEQSLQHGKKSAPQ